MKPLREDTGSDPDVLAAQSLLSRVSPLEPSPDRQRRVRLRLEAAGQRSLPPLLRPALVAGVLLAVTAAGAKMGGGLPPSPSRAVERLFSQPVRELGAPLARVKARVVAPPPRAAENVTAEPELEAGPSQAVEAANPRRSRTSTHTAAPAPSSPGAKLMVEAMQARRAGDSARAAQLLNEYQRKYPDGALQEEALALSMEAAAARGDAGAPKLARQYLERFPNGRFREQAQRVLRTARD